MKNSDETFANPYAPPAASSAADEIPEGMEIVAEDWELANWLKVRKQTPASSLLSLAIVGFWAAFVSTLFGVVQIWFPAPDELDLPLWATSAALGVTSLAAFLLVGVSVFRPKRRLELSATGLGILSAELLLAVVLWGAVALLFDGIWRDSIGILIWIAPIGLFLGFGLLAIWAGRYAERRLAQAGISESAIKGKGGRIYDFRR